MTNPGGLCLFTFLLLPLVRAQEASTPAKPAQKYDAAVSVSQSQGAVQHPSLASQEPEGFIHLDVMVTDPTGKPVSGLKAADFAVLDEGQPKKIVSFHAYDGVSAKPDHPVKIILVLDMLEAPELASQAPRAGSDEEARSPKGMHDKRVDTRDCNKAVIQPLPYTSDVNTIMCRVYTLSVWTRRQLCKAAVP